MRLISIFFSMLFLFTSCSKDLSLAAYGKYFQENKKLFNLTQGSNPELTLGFIPLEKILVENAQELTIEELKSEYKEIQLKETSCFDLYISNNNDFANQKNISQREQTEFYSINFKRNIFAVTKSNDTVNCTGYLFQAGSSFGNSSYFEFQFNKSIKEIEKVLISSPYFKDTLVEISTKQFQREFPKLKIK